MGTVMSLPKGTFIIGKSNRNAHNLYRLYNIQDHLFPYDLKPGKANFQGINLSVALEVFNSIVTQKLDVSLHKSQMTEKEFEVFKTILNPSKVLQKVLVTDSDARDAKIEMSTDDKQIYLCRNYLVEVHELIGKLKSVTILQLCCNYLKFLPYGIGQLKQLKMLIVSRNRIVEIPEEIGMCKELREIDLSYNLIRYLPRSVAGLKKLNTLQLGGNLMRKVPCFLGKLHSLKYLNISNNPIMTIPLEILKLPFLLSLNCNGCNLRLIEKRFEVVGAMTLKETVGRNIIRKNLRVRRNITLSLQELLLSVKECCFCGGPFFNYFVDVQDTFIFDSEEYPIDYKMCSMHYRRHEDRLSTLFERTVQTFPSRIYEENLPSVCEMFEPICLDDRQRKMMDEGVEGKEDTMPLISLAKRNHRDHQRNGIDSILRGHYENLNPYDDLLREP